MVMERIIKITMILCAVGIICSWALTAGYVNRGWIIGFVSAMLGIIVMAILFFKRT